VGTFLWLANDKIFLIEANFYGGGGSKLKSTAGEYAFTLQIAFNLRAL